jgi:hypothetical protein
VWVTIGAVIAGLGLAAAIGWSYSGRLRPTPAIPAAAYVGQPVCAECHAEAAQRWRASNHARAMQAATDATVTGDFK